jgi:uncharacterized protein YwqG
MSLARLRFEFNLSDFGYDADSNSDSEDVDCGHAQSNDENSIKKSMTVEDLSEQEVLTIKSDMERRADEAAKQRHVEWLRHRHTLEHAIHDMFKDHIEMYEKAQTLRLNFEAEQAAWVQKLSAQFYSRKCDDETNRGEKRKEDLVEEFEYDIPQNRLSVNIQSHETFEHLAYKFETPPQAKKRQRKFHTPVKVE